MNAGSAPAVSSCVVSGSDVTLTWGRDATAVDFVVNLLNVAAWAPSTLTVGGSLTNFG